MKSDPNYGRTTIEEYVAMLGLPLVDRRYDKGARRTTSQWRAVGWNYQRVMPFDMWADIGCPEPSPRIFGHTIQCQRDIDAGRY